MSRLHQPLRVEYDPETDVLTLWNGTPSSEGSPVARSLAVYVDEEELPAVVTLERASEYLRRHFPLPDQPFHPPAKAPHLQSGEGLFLLVPDRFDCICETGDIVADSRSINTIRHMVVPQ